VSFHPLAVRFAAHVSGGSPAADRDRIVVAVSGGIDSMVLLHLLRFAPGLPALGLVAAHLDHAMREGSAGDALWLKGVCSAWEIPLLTERLEGPPAGEAAARQARYSFLERAREECGARLCVTAHHADDQAETVLFRAVRDGEPRGLVGIRERREPDLWRPLLPFQRSEIEAYGESVHLTWREDPTNLQPFARNILRHRILPEIEATVAPAARRSLRRLARRIAEDEEAWSGLSDLLRRAADVRTEAAGFSMDRSALLELHPAVRGRLLRELAAALGERLSEAGTRSAVEFTSSGSSGRHVQPCAGLALRRDLGRLALVPRGSRPLDIPVEIPGAGEGSAVARIGGVSWRVRWSMGVRTGSAEMFEADRLCFPLTVRGRKPGDRLRLDYGTKKVKKVLLEARIPAAQRASVPVLAEGRGRVLWLAGVARSVDALPKEDHEVLTIEIANADVD
jgi:tRNA(Ile)-lysidine synthase